MEDSLIKSPAKYGRFITDDVQMDIEEILQNGTKNAGFAIDEKLRKKVKELVSLNTVYTNEKVIVIEGAPKAWKRHRSSRFSGMYDPNTPTKMVIQSYFKEELGPDFSMILGPLSFKVDSFKPMPKSMSKAEAVLYETRILMPPKKPDVDNFAKLMQDAINNIVYKDDAQIVELISRKYLSFTPRTEITMRW